MAVIFVAIFVKLFYLQVINDDLKLISEHNTRKRIAIYPSRGLIFDNKGTVLVSNELVYDLLITPKYVRNIDSAKLICKYLNIDTTEFRIAYEKAKKYSKIKSSVFYKLLTREQHAQLQEILHQFPGFSFQQRTMRKYNENLSGHIIGDVGEISLKELQNDPYYSGGDFIGKSGVEKSYENILRGQKGIEYILVDVNNRKVGKYENGINDTLAVEGKSLTLTIDLEFQRYCEKIMANKIGCIVAIDPQNGEIITLVSSPDFNPSELIGRQRSQNYKILMEDTRKPLLNRAVASEYPPGSVFKIAQVLVGLDMNVIKKSSYFPCDYAFVGCHNHPPCTDVSRGIQFSCNPYFYYVYKKIILQGKTKNVFSDSEIGLNLWHDKIITLAFGAKLDIGLPNVKSGYVPDSKFYDKIYGHHRWAFSTIYSNAIGQGEVLATPLQIANFGAIIANKGYYYIPHIVKSVDSVPETKYTQKNHTPFKEEFFIPIIRGMFYVVNEEYGTGNLAYINNIIVCGKTGTAQNKGKDHSVFMAFAPMNNPKIALCVYVENAGWGNQWAAPISRLVIEKYLNHCISDTLFEQRIINTSLIGTQEH